MPSPEEYRVLVDLFPDVVKSEEFREKMIKLGNSEVSEYDLQEKKRKEEQLNLARQSWNKLFGTPEQTANDPRFQVPEVPYIPDQRPRGGTVNPDGTQVSQPSFGGMQLKSSDYSQETIPMSQMNFPDVPRYNAKRPGYSYEIGSTDQRIDLTPPPQEEGFDVSVPLTAKQIRQRATYDPDEVRYTPGENRDVEIKAKEDLDRLLRSILK